MKLYLESKTKGITAEGEYNPETGEFIVLKGSVLSETVVTTGTFRGARSILKAREGCVRNNVLMKNMTFKSASTAANFVKGVSSNGLISWKDITGKTLKAILTEGESNE